MKELIRRVLREQTDEAMRVATLPGPTIDRDRTAGVTGGIAAKSKDMMSNIKGSEIFYLPGDKKWEYTLLDDIWHTRGRDSDGRWLSLGGDKFKDTVQKLNKSLLNIGPKGYTQKSPNTNICTFIIPVAWPDYTPKVESNATDTEVWMARIYAALTNRDYESREGTYGKLGHGGVATVESDGRVRLFEFGRYDGSKTGMGITLKKDLGKIATFQSDGKRCRISNIKEIANTIKANSYGDGQILDMEGYLVSIPNVEKAIEWANTKTQRKYKAIDLEIGDDEFNCGTFVYDVAEKGGLEMGSYCFPDPKSMVNSFARLPETIGRIKA